MTSTILRVRPRLQSLIVLASLGACSGSATETLSSGSTGSTGSITVASVTITPSTLSLVVGATGTLSAQVLSATGAMITGKTVTWTSASTNIATVASNGTVTAVAPGVALITATVDAKSAVVSVTVTAPVSGQASFASIYAGGGHTCALSAQGKAYCWGYNLYGEVGTGSQTFPFKATAVASSIAFASLSAGDNQTCGVALSPQGAVYCWGFNHFGQLGDGTTTDRGTPTLVANGGNFVMVSTGTSLTCALSVSGDAYCWGLGGNLGDGTSTSSSRPVPVIGGFKFISITVGGNHACGLTQSGQGYCWGQNGGYLGDGTDSTRQAPTPIAGNITFRSLVASTNGACGITANDVTYCWGGKIPQTLNRSPTVVPGISNFASLAVGPSAVHSCALNAAHAAYCWGSNTDGQTGDGGTAGNVKLTPVAVQGGLTFASLAAGANHTCGLTTSGLAYCWGGNGFGQLGAATQVNTTVPVAVLAP